MFMDVKLNSNFIYDGEIGLLSPQKKKQMFEKSFTIKNICANMKTNKGSCIKKMRRLNNEYE